MKAVRTKHINTGCKYSDKGQRITIEFYSDKTAQMIDHDRGLDYIYKNTLTVASVILAYLHNQNSNDDFPYQRKRTTLLRQMRDTVTFEDRSSEYHTLTA